MQRIDSLVPSINQRFPRIICNIGKLCAREHTRLREFVLRNFTSQQFKILQHGCNPNIAADYPSHELQKKSSRHCTTRFSISTAIVQNSYPIDYAHSDNGKNT